MRRVRGLHVGEQGEGYAEWPSACLAGRKYFRITPQGTVTPCPYLPGTVGDLRTQTLRGVWEQNVELQRLRTEYPGGKCGACDYRLSCGGCRARAYAACGDIMAEDPKCPYIPAADAGPETRIEPAAPPLTWTPEARARLTRIPAFLRGADPGATRRARAGAGVERNRH
ncbi:MAG: SPASM domain-containing protein [Sulfuricaulis sp.]|nr:SPASM domain-containing protein [Sulfuricaulis sp.]